MKLLIDIGNTRAKVAVTDADGRVVAEEVAEEFDKALLESLLARYALHAAILSSTRGATCCEEQLLAEKGIPTLVLSAFVPLPIVIDYRTPETLGRDRIAAAAAVAEAYAGRNCLVVDLGTALTLDLVTADAVFRGGAISLGYSNRLRALHEYTASLPLCEPIEGVEEPFALQGHTTCEAITRGVFHSILFEIEGYRRRLEVDFPDLCVIVTGGEAKYFEKRIKNAIFAERNLVLNGLNRILDYNLARNATAKK